MIGDRDAAPRSFLWRGRLYVVREVLGHWRDRREWWASAAARALHGEQWTPSSGAEAALDQEREVWRVEASAGRSYSSGVYDLSREAPPREAETRPRESPAVPAAVTEAWQLLQVAD